MRNRRAPLKAADIRRIDWAKGGGLVPAVVQDRATRQVLMLAHMNEASLAETLATKRAVFFSRSRNEIWRKGDTSGDVMREAEVFADCDSDALLVLVDPAGPACHEKTTSCFTEETAPGVGRLGALERVIAARAAEGASESYTARLLAAGAKRAAQKVGEEGLEVALAGAAGEKEELCEEAADLLYHLLVLLRARGAALEDVMAVLERRATEATR
ncbi:MAG: bifunctional phosphoribosyl-AMP cyclohydrolase/phosphoribosyl-ATP diphosphatase HisIE [Alphaproteobacteria bacterium]|nr:bifunctional phosphoribosyl-AMP cyclohydrolase/phosphoribosyl-ATP diphosphatase HisIE [Alphaproteobacteria bacterium]